ncbi:hypothetical protein AAFC00_003606 [Neodothiora populina]|uniref:Uncharacterized protein n=1 Tax=Neodothiora populina TaxID=2781224 RepID=A0ABR3PF09_9PEZI
MSDQTNHSPPNGPATRRRSSFAGQAFAGLFGGRNRSTSQSDANYSPPGQYTGPITAAAAQANQRRLSVSTLGVGTSPPGSGAYFVGRARRDSVSSSAADESAVEEELSSATVSQPATPFARRASFGARALRDMNKNGGGNGGNNGSNGRVSTSTIPEEDSTLYCFSDGGGGGGEGGKKGRSSPIDVAGSGRYTSPTTAKGRGLSSSSTRTAGGLGFVSSFVLHSPRDDVLTFRDRTESGFNWADNMRTRAERTSFGGATQMGTSPVMGSHHRAKSVAVMDQPVRESPRAAPPLDYTQERILKGDFYMD